MHHLREPSETGTPFSGWHGMCLIVRSEVRVPKLSPHATPRRAQRSVAPDHIELALDWGTPIHQREGRVAWHLGRREVCHARSVGVQVPPRAVGVAVIQSQDGTVVTVARSHNRHRLRVHGWRSRPRRPAQGGL